MVIVALFHAKSPYPAYVAWVVLPLPPELAEVARPTSRFAGRGKVVVVQRVHSVVLVACQATNSSPARRKRRKTFGNAAGLVRVPHSVVMEPVARRTVATYWFCPVEGAANINSWRESELVVSRAIMPERAHALGVMTEGICTTMSKSPVLDL